MKFKALSQILLIALLINTMQSIVWTEEIQTTSEIVKPIVAQEQTQIPLSDDKQMTDGQAMLLGSIPSVDSIADDFNTQTADLSAMGWSFSGLNSADSMAINATGALEFIRGTVGTSGAKISRSLNLNKADKYIVEYRFKIIGTNVFDSLGTIDTYTASQELTSGNLSTYANGADNATKTLVTSCRDTAGNVSNPSYGLISTLGIDSSWIKVKYVLNANTDKFSAYVNDKLDVSLNLENTRFKINDDVDMLSSISFGVPSSAVTSSGTLAIDYFKAYSVNDVIPPSTENYVMYENFDNLPTGYIPTPGVDGWKVTYTNKKSATNEYYPNSVLDSVSVQSGVLQMMKGAYPGTATSGVTAMKLLDPTKFPATGNLVMQWDINVKRNSMYNTAFPSFDAVDKDDKAVAGFLQTLFYTDKYMTKYYNGPTKDLLTTIGKADATGYTAGTNSDKWYTIKYIVDLDKYLYDAFVYDRATGALTKTYLSLPFNLLPSEGVTLKNLTQFSLYMGEASNIPDSTPAGIYLLDNISMYYASKGNSLSVNNVRPLNGSTNVALNTTYTLNFDREVSASTVNSNNIVVTRKDGSLVTGYTAVATGTSGLNNQIKITFGTPLDSQTTYHVSVTKNVMGVDNTVLDDVAVYTFTTANTSAVYDNFNASLLSGWTFNIPNSADGDTATVTTENGVTALKLHKTDTTTGSTISATRSNPFTAPGKYVVEFMAKVSNFKQSFDGFPILGAQKGGSDMAIPLGMLDSTAGHYIVSREDGGTDKIDIASDWSGYPSMWHVIKYVIDTETDTFDCFLNGTLLDSKGTLAIPLDMSFATSGSKVDIDGLKDITFRVKTLVANGGIATDFYLDNVAIYPVSNDLSICGVNPENGSVGAGINDSINLILSRDTLASSVTQGMFSVQSEDGDVVNVTGMTLNLLSGQNRLVKLTTSGLISGTKYTVTMASGAIDMSGAKMATPYSFEFTTAGQKPIPQSIYDNFDKTADGQLPSGWTVSKTASLPEDEIAVYGGALKIFKSGSTLNSKIAVTRENLVDTNMSKTVVEFNARFESHGQSLESFPDINGYKGSNTPFVAVGGKSSGSGYGARYENGGNDYISVIDNITDDPNRWYKIKYVINPITDKFDVYLDGVALPSCSKLPFQIISGTQPLDTDGIGNITFSVRCTDINSSDETVWLDDFRIYKVADDLSITTVTPLNAEENIGVDTTWQAVFSRPINANTLKNNIIVQDEQGNNIYYSSTLGADLKTLTLTFVSFLKNNTVYTIRVKKDISDNNSSTMAEDTEYTFKTNDSILGTVFVDNFENIVIGASPTDGWTSDMKNAEVGDSFSVEEDTQNAGNKALKMVKKSATANSFFSIDRNYTGAEFGKISVEYKFRAEKHTQYLTAGGQTSGYKYQTDGSKKSLICVPALSYMNTLYFKFEDGGNDTFVGISNMNADNKKWYNIKYIIDTDTDTYEMYLDGAPLKSNAKFSVSDLVAMDIDGINKLTFSIKNNNAGADDSIYWIDDITVKKLFPFTITYAEPSQNTTSVAIRPVQTLYFNMDVDSSTITKSSVKVLNGIVELPADNYNLTLQQNKLQITFNEDLDYKTIYTVKVVHGVKSSTTEVATLTADYSTSFTTRAPSFDVEYLNIVDSNNAAVTSLMDAKGQTIKVSGALKNVDLPTDQSYAMTIALVNSNGAMISYKSLMGIVKTGSEKTFEVSMDIPQNADNGYKINYFIWNSYSDMKKLYSFIVKP